MAIMTAPPVGLVDEFLAQTTIPLYVDGQWRDAQGGAALDVLRPAYGTSLARVAAATAKDVDDAVRAAERALPRWASMPAPDRAVILHRFADLIEANIDELARLESMDVGKVLTQTRDFDIPHERRLDSPPRDHGDHHRLGCSSTWAERARLSGFAGDAVAVGVEVVRVRPGHRDRTDQVVAVPVRRERRHAGAVPGRTPAPGSHGRGGRRLRLP
jgi:hypothetical protein